MAKTQSLESSHICPHHNIYPVHTILSLLLIVAIITKTTIMLLCLSACFSGLSTSCNHYFCVRAFLCICGLIWYLLSGSAPGSTRHKGEDSEAHALVEETNNVGLATSSFGFFHKVALVAFSCL